MPSYGRSSTVRSHRRGGGRRRIVLGPVLIVGSVIALVSAGVVAGYAYFVKNACTGQATATVVVNPQLESILLELNRVWAETSPSVDGTCASVTIVASESPDVATALTGEWDTTIHGPRPDVWVPESSAWVRKASVDLDAERIMPDLQPSLARTPTVIAMPKEMAEAAGMTSDDLTWQQIMERLNTASGWRAYQRDEWGPFKVALSDPQASTAGLLALMAISDTDDNGDVSDEEKAALLDLKKVVTVTAESTNEIFEGLAAAARDDPAKGLTYVSAFPALEQEVLTYNLDDPQVPLVAVYPANGMAEADFPYLVLNAEWASAERQEVAAEFLSYLRSAEGEAAFLAAGYRDNGRDPGPELTTSNGLSSEVTALPRAVLLPESVQYATASWTAVTRPTNVLFVFDASGSTAAIVRGTGKSSLALTKAAALGAVDLLDDSARVGVWSFATVGSGTDHRRLLNVGPLSRQRDAARSAINGLRSGGNTGLYNTAWAACQEVTAKYQENATNLVVLLTDGADDNNIAGSLSLEKLIDNLKGSCGGTEKPVQLITIGLGTGSDSAILRQISAATNAPSYSSPRSFDISQVVLSAVFA
jgi:Ca-activated chloride channel family protein